MARRSPLTVLWLVMYAIVLSTPFNPLLTSPAAAIAYIAFIVVAHGTLLYLQSERDLRAYEGVPEPVGAGSPAEGE